MARKSTVMVVGSGNGDGAVVVAPLEAAVLTSPVQLVVATISPRDVQLKPNVAELDYREEHACPREGCDGRAEAYKVCCPDCYASGLMARIGHLLKVAQGRDQEFPGVKPDAGKVDWHVDHACPVVNCEGTAAAGAAVCPECAAKGWVKPALWALRKLQGGDRKPNVVRQEPRRAKPVEEPPEGMVWCAGDTRVHAVALDDSYVVAHFESERDKKSAIAVAKKGIGPRLCPRCAAALKRFSQPGLIVVSSPERDSTKVAGAVFADLLRNMGSNVTVTTRGNGHKPLSEMDPEVVAAIHRESRCGLCGGHARHPKGWVCPDCHNVYGIPGVEFVKRATMVQTLAA